MLTIAQPTIIRDLGYSAARAQLFTVPPYAAATILTVVIAYLSERTRKRAPFIMFTSSLAIIGYIILIANHETALKTTRATNAKTGVVTTTVTRIFVHPYISYIGTFFCTCGIYPSTALALSWPAVNVSGQTKRAASGALQISIGNLGAVIGTQIYRTQMAPRYVPGHAVALAYLAANVAVAGITWWYLARENRKREALEASQPADVKVGPIMSDDDVRFRFTT